MEGESHREVSEKSLVESTLKQQVEHLMQEVAALNVPPVSSSVRVSQDGGNRQETYHRRLEVHLQRCSKAVFARYGHRGVQVGRSPQSWSPTQSSKSFFFERVRDIVVRRASDRFHSARFFSSDLEHCPGGNSSHIGRHIWS